MLVNPGDTPGPGVYECTYCARQLELRRASTSLPPCARCGQDERTRYRRVHNVTLQ